VSSLEVPREDGGRDQGSAFMSKGSKDCQHIRNLTSLSQPSEGTSSAATLTLSFHPNSVSQFLLFKSSTHWRMQQAFTSLSFTSNHVFKVHPRSSTSDHCVLGPPGLGPGVLTAGIL
jgi:hypothetical protein